jgi:hypothetical protein
MHWPGTIHCGFPKRQKIGREAVARKPNCFGFRQRFQKRHDEGMSRVTVAEHCFQAPSAFGFFKNIRMHKRRC